MNLVRVIANQNDEVVYANFGLPNHSMYVYEGGTKMQGLHYQSRLSRGVRTHTHTITELDSDWQIDLSNGFQVTGDETLLYEFVFRSGFLSVSYTHLTLPTICSV